MRRKVTVVLPDSTVVVDGQAYKVNLPAVQGHETVHSVVWDGEKGEKDMGDGSLPLPISTEGWGIDVWPYVRAWDAAQAAVRKEEAVVEAAEWAMYHSPEAVERRVRKERDKRLAETDYVFAADYPELTDESMAAVKSYRQALRDLTRQAGWPWTDESVPWPVKPAMVRKEA